MKEGEYAFVETLAEGLVPDYVTIDIAHGHSNAVINMIQHLKKSLPETFVIAGNVGTPEAVRELETLEPMPKWGLDQEKFVLLRLRLALGRWLAVSGFTLVCQSCSETNYCRWWNSDPWRHCKICAFWGNYGHDWFIICWT